MPKMVSASSLQTLEIARLTNDPIFGDINKGRILNADKIIREHRFSEEPEVKESRKQFMQKIKHPITAHEFKLRNEHRKIQKCEKLIAKMGSVISNNDLCRPATLSNI